jgi:hypothetical protein
MHIFVLVIRRITKSIYRSIESSFSMLKRYMAVCIAEYQLKKTTFVIHRHETPTCFISTSFTNRQSSTVSLMHK